jgi:hypothetical protein
MNLVPFMVGIKEEIFGSETKGGIFYVSSFNELFIRSWGTFWSSN